MTPTKNCYYITAHKLGKPHSIILALGPKFDQSFWTVEDIYSKKRGIILIDFLIAELPSTLDFKASFDEFQSYYPEYFI